MPAVATQSAKSYKTIPLRLYARSPNPVDRAPWGRVVHDFAGLAMHKDVLAIDVNHGEEVGFFATENVRVDDDAGLVIDGFLVLTGEPGDPAAKLLARHKSGVPYEASIDFRGGGLEVETVLAGHTARVNGRTFTGPGKIIRKWPLRGVAIVPHGADRDTAALFAASPDAPPLAAQFSLLDDLKNLHPHDPAHPSNQGVASPVGGSGRKPARRKPKVDDSQDGITRIADRSVAQALAGKTKFPAPVRQTNGLNFRFPDET